MYRHFSRLALLLLCFDALTADFSSAQGLINSSFENDGQFTTDGWLFTHAQPSCITPSEVALPEGGAYSLRLELFNVQGGCASVAYQLVPQVTSGDVWRLSAWVQTPEGSEHAAGIYWTTFDSTFFGEDVDRYLPQPASAVAVSSSHAWTLLSVTDTLYFQAGDSIGIVLQAGLTGGVTMPDLDYTLFDLITVEKIGHVPSATEQPRDQGSVPLQNSPNPFTSSTTISYSLSTAAHVTLRVYDALGREIETLVQGWRPAGLHQAVFDGRARPAGVYLCRLSLGDRTEIRRMTLIK